MKSEWSQVRLELARTPEFPDGSVGRAYILRMPLTDEALIDEIALARNPAMATVRRHWPNEADQRGYIVRRGKGWAFSYALGDDDDDSVYHLEAHPLRVGESVTIIDWDGQPKPFRVVSSEADGTATWAFSQQPPGRAADPAG